MVTSSPAFVTDTTGVLANFRKRFKENRRPIEVNFRELVPWIPYNSERFTHQIHPYPAKLIPQIPHFFLANSSLSEHGDTILDPFCGTGTVLLEACLLGRNAMGCDSNPLARLISTAKTRAVSPTILTRHYQRFLIELSRTGPISPPDVVNIDYWFYPHIIRELSIIIACIDKLPTEQLRAIWMIAFSACVRKASLTDPRVSVPVRLRPERYSKNHPLREKSEIHLRKLKQLNVQNLFLKILTETIEKIKTLSVLGDSLGRVNGIYSDTCNPGPNTITKIADASIRLIVTSPPYLGAQKYVRATSLSLGWLSLWPSRKLRVLEDKCVGREHFLKASRLAPHTTGILAADAILKRIEKQNPLRRQIAETYLLEMSKAFSECARVLARDGRLVLVAGANTVCGMPFDTPTFLKEIAEAHGFLAELILVDHIRSRGLMTKRNKTAGLIPAEKVMLFRHAT